MLDVFRGLPYNENIPLPVSNYEIRNHPAASWATLLYYNI